MTFFANQTFSVDASSLLKYIPSDDNQSLSKHGYHEFSLSIPQTFFQNDKYLKIKFIEFDLQILNNNYPYLQCLWDILTQSNFKMSYSYKINNTEFSIKHDKLPIQITNDWNVIKSAIPNLNPLYNEIDKLPHLKFSLLNDYVLENGFSSNSLIISNIFNYLIYSSKFKEMYNFSFFDIYDFKLFQNFKINITIEYQTEI